MLPFVLPWQNGSWRHSSLSLSHRYAVRLPVKRTPGVVYFNPMLHPPVFSKHQVKLVKWFQVPQAHLGMVMGRISMSVQAIPN